MNLNAESLICLLIVIFFAAAGLAAVGYAFGSGPDGYVRIPSNRYCESIGYVQEVK